MLEPGDRIGRYEIQRRLGRGGMGTVYVAHDPILGRMVAVKTFAGELDAPDAAGKFAREARAAAALNHTNIVTIHDFGEFSSQPFIVMEYVKGETVARLIRTKAPWSLSERLRAIQELCSGVAYAHGFDVIHRDIKPANLMVDGSGRLKILDFGIARMLGNSMSKATALIGTPGYMAPEQILGSAVDRRSDLFSIGVVCYELLSYAEAFPGDSVPAITHRIMHEEPVSLTGLVPNIPADLVGIVEKALKKNAADRFADAESFGAAIAKVRRQLGGDTESETLAPTLPGGSRSANRGTGPGSGSGSGPGSVVGGSRDVAGARTTPASTPSRGAGDEIVGRRRRKVEAFLNQARDLAQSGDLEAALEACVEALMLDDTHADALEVDRAIRAAQSKRRASAMLLSARDELNRGSLTGAQDLLGQARDLDPEAAEVRRLDRDLRLARVEQEQARQRAASVARALEAARASLARGDIEAALASARQALQLDPTSEAARQAEADAHRSLDLELGPPDSQAGGAPTVLASRSAETLVSGSCRGEPGGSCGSGRSADRGGARRSPGAGAVAATTRSFGGDRRREYRMGRAGLVRARGDTCRRVAGYRDGAALDRQGPEDSDARRGRGRRICHAWTLAATSGSARCGASTGPTREGVRIQPCVDGRLGGRHSARRRGDGPGMVPDGVPDGVVPDDAPGATAGGPRRDRRGALGHDHGGGGGRRYRSAPAVGRIDAALASAAGWRLPGDTGRAAVGDTGGRCDGRRRQDGVGLERDVRRDYR